MCGATVRPGALRCDAHSSAARRSTPRGDGFLEATGTGAVATSARIDPGVPLAGPDGTSSSVVVRLQRVGRSLRTPALVALAIVGFNLAFPVLVANQRPTVLSQSGAISAAAAAPSHPAPATVPAWDPVDVDLFMVSCRQSEPVVVCSCEVQALPPYYSGEQALAYADEQANKAGRAVLPPRYKAILVRCSATY